MGTSVSWCITKSGWIWLARAHSVAQGTYLAILDDMWTYMHWNQWRNILQHSFTGVLC
uniref:Uncharacterized protein n=1 Tax=Picea sitchensis TaxID=3332 RepID=A9NW17_PICSI|nr:unknown [Picea sitchensis]